MQLGLSGRNINFHKEDFFGLKPNQSVIQIGNGKENGTIRTDFFKSPIMYSGSIICQFDKKEKMYAFKLTEKEGDEELYLLYGSTGEEIFTEAVFSIKSRVTGKISSYMRFYKPEFKIVNV
ncbi:hypothetical protein [Myroides odoratus]|uniref:hypothetical protein n=1 Tax=Myroides odoratus TaxID=256 RepID=UPI00333FBD85